MKAVLSKHLYYSLVHNHQFVNGKIRIIDKLTKNTAGKEKTAGKMLYYQHRAIKRLHIGKIKTDLQRRTGEDTDEKI